MRNEHFENFKKWRKLEFQNFKKAFEATGVEYASSVAAAAEGIITGFLFIRPGPRRAAAGTLS